MTERTHSIFCPTWSIHDAESAESVADVEKATTSTNHVFLSHVTATTVLVHPTVGDQSASELSFLDESAQEVEIAPAVSLCPCFSLELPSLKKATPSSVAAFPSDVPTTTVVHRVVGDNKKSDTSFIDENTDEVQIAPAVSLCSCSPLDVPPAKKVFGSAAGNMLPRVKQRRAPSTMPFRPRVHFTEPDPRDLETKADILSDHAIKPSTSDRLLAPLRRPLFNCIAGGEEAGDRASNPPSYLDGSHFFRDGKRRIDMVIAYTVDEEDDAADGNDIKRLKYENVLRGQGLELELEKGTSQSEEKQRVFLKVHIPWRVLRKQAEQLKFSLPLKLNDADGMVMPKRTGLWNKLMKAWGSPFDYDHVLIPDQKLFYTDQFTRTRESDFIINDHDTVFDPSQRSQVVWYLMRKAKYNANTLTKESAELNEVQDDEEKDGEKEFNKKMGILKLINKGVYSAAYPLHDGRYQQDGPMGRHPQRRLLYMEWARFGKWYKKQPLWLVKEYFGRKIGLYFAWLGFYTGMLIIPGILGFLVIIYGGITINNDENVNRDICDYEGAGNYTICPSCDKACKYEKLSSYCGMSKLSYVFGNTASVAFAAFMSFWSTYFLKMWKRRQAVLVWELDLQDAEEVEEPRPEFEDRVNTYRIDPVTQEREPYVPACTKFGYHTATASIVMFMLMVVLITVMAIIIYRLSMVSAFHNFGNVFIKKYSRILVTITGAIINLIAIMVLGQLYEYTAITMVEMENPRTQTEYEHSFTLKKFVFQFINFYSSLLYIAMFKGRFFHNPGDASARDNAFLRLRIDVCDPTGCLGELCIQMFVVMVGKQALMNCMELLLPLLRNWFRKKVKKLKSVDKTSTYIAWEEDFTLTDLMPLDLLDEYLEMIIQYGFITLFTAALPLAPFFALINNIIEIRLDAYKMVTQMRRPVAQRVKDIGAWYGILQALTFIAVVTNAFVIAFNSNFIPGLVYQWAFSASGKMTGFVDWILTDFDTNDYREDMTPEESDPYPRYCKYRGFRNGPDSPDKYVANQWYWHVSAARFIFIVVFVLVVFSLPGLMAYFIPDVPEYVALQIKREKYVVKRAQQLSAEADPLAYIKLKRQLDKLTG